MSRVRAAWAIGVLLFCVGAAEFLLRWTVSVARGTPYVTGSRDFHYVQKPGTSGRHISPGEFDAEFHINFKGLRGQEIHYERNHVDRILALGDSFTFGFGVAERETWPAQLQRMVWSPIEVINAGVMGWGLAEYLIWFRKEGRKYQPDLVVVGVHASDWENAGNGLTSLDSHGNVQIHQAASDAHDKVRSIAQWIPFYETLMTHSALANVVRGVTVKLLHRNRATASGEGRSNEDSFYDFEKLNYALLKELDHQVREAGGKLLLLFLPKYEALYPESDPDIVSHLFQKRLHQWTLGLGIPLYDMWPVYRDVLDRNGKDPSYLYFLKDGHSNARAYRLIANTITAYIGYAEGIAAR